MNEIRQLTGLRGIAALDVLLGHYDFHYVPFAKDLIFHDAAVDVFFCLSAFTLCMVYGAGGDRPLSLKKFAVARIARIYPVYFATLMLSVIILAVFAPQQFDPVNLGRTLAHVAWQLCLLAAMPAPSLSGFWDIPAWSVSVEAFCYALVFPILFAASRLASRLPASILLGVMAAMVLVDLGAFEFGYDARVNGIGFGTASVFAYWVAICRGVSMFLAGWLVFLLATGSPAFSRISWALCDATALCFLCIVVAASRGFGERQYVVVLAPLLIAGLLNAHSVTSWLLASVPCVFLGSISYSLYLVHIPVAIAYRLRPILHAGPADFYAPFLISMSLATMSYYWLEAPSRDLIRRLFLLPRTREHVAVMRADAHAVRQS